jgi:hypothetical protein
MNDIYTSVNKYFKLFSNSTEFIHTAKAIGFSSAGFIKKILIMVQNYHYKDLVNYSVMYDKSIIRDCESS